MNPADQKRLVEAQVLISQSLQGISHTLEKINDQNILHATQNQADHNEIVKAMQDFTKRWWWLILILVAALVILAGAEKVFQLFPIGK